MDLQETHNKLSKQSGGFNSNAKSNLGSSSKTIMLLVAFFISCGIMFYLVSPMRKEAKIIKFANETKMKDIETGRLLFLKIVKINSKNKKINNEEIEKIGGLISNRNSYEDYLAHIVNLANKKNIGISSFSVSGGDGEKSEKKNGEEEIKNKALNKISIDIAASGNFSDFMSFARDIENGVPFVCEKSISISRSESDDDDESGEELEEGDAVEVNTNPILDYEMNIEFYYY